MVMHCLMHRETYRLGGGDGAEGARASVVDQTSMGGEDRAGILVDRPQPFRAGLLPDRRQLIRIVRGELPVACPPLDERKEPVAPRGVGVCSGEGRFQLSLLKLSRAVHVTRPELLVDEHFRRKRLDGQ